MKPNGVTEDPGGMRSRVKNIHDVGGQKIEGLCKEEVTTWTVSASTAVQKICQLRPGISFNLASNSKLPRLLHSSQVKSSLIVSKIPYLTIWGFVERCHLYLLELSTRPEPTATGVSPMLRTPIFAQIPTLLSYSGVMPPPRHGLELFVSGCRFDRTGDKWRPT